MLLSSIRLLENESYGIYKPLGDILQNRLHLGLAI